MSADSANTADESASYSYRPSPIGAPRVVKLAGEGIEWATGRNDGRIAFRDIRRLRMSYKPSGMQSHRFITEIWADGAPKLKIVSSSWKSMFDQERQDKAYADFISALHRRMTAASPARFEQGTHPLMYWPGVIVFFVLTIGVAGLIVRAIEAGTWGGAAFVAVFLVFFLWRGRDFFRRNRPGVYRPDALPAELMPKG